MSSGEVHFIHVYWLALLPLLWIYLAFWFTRVNLNTIKLSSSIADIELSSQSHFYHPLAESLSKQSHSQKKATQSFWQKSIFWWQTITISCLIVALAQPILVGKRLPDPPAERDILFLVDTSVSMQLKDYELEGKPIRRMDLLHNLLDEFASKMAGDRIAVIIFAEEPYILVPLSHDQGLIRRMLSRVTTTLAGRSSAIGEALLMALREAQKQADRHQTFILFTDADASRGKVTPAAAADLIAENQIPIFTIAIGSSQLDKDQQVKVNGGLYQPVNLALLEDIATRTSGNHYQVNNSESMKQALQKILNQRQNLATPMPQFNQTSLYFYPLMMGLFMLLALQLKGLLAGKFGQEVR